MWKTSEHLAVAATVADLKPRPDGSPVLSFLLPPQPGYFCPECTALRTINWDCFRVHIGKVHHRSATQYRKADVSCFLQRWSIGQGHSASKAWIVDTQREPPSYADVLELDRDPSLDGERSAERTLADMEAAEEARLCDESQSGAPTDDELETDENSDWLRGCGWPRWFHQKPIPLLVNAATIPGEGYVCDLFLGRWHGLECVSPAASERALQLLVSASWHVLARCQETLGSTPRILRCWVRSWTHSYFPYPFDLPTVSTVRRYSRIWIAGLCYFVRLRLLANSLREDMAVLSGVQLSDPQKSAIDDVWGMLTQLVATERPSPESMEIPNECLEAIFQLFVTFWTEVPPDGDLESTAIARFSGILGVHPTEFNFRTAYTYTPRLSALIWIGRLVLLEYALPSRPYNQLQIPWPSREAYTDLASRLCSQIRPKYLQRGSLAPMGYLIERLQHGRAIAKREGPHTNISWSQDKQELTLDQSSITMAQFRYVVHNVIMQAQQCLDDLLLDWWPTLRIQDVRDDMPNRRPGYSFLSDPANQLQCSFRILSRRAFSAEGKFALTGRGRYRAIEYLKVRDRLMRVLFSAVHLTSGMPARGEELRLIRWANTSAVPRNIFIHDGKVLLIFRYNKACTNHNNSFYVVRRPCPAIERILFVYLTYVRPFCDLLHRELLGTSGGAINRHLFNRHDWETACFSPAMCLKSLQIATRASPVKLTIRNYRQIAVAISKQHLPSLLRPFDAHAPNDYDGFLRLLSFQTGHKPSTHSGAYALEHAFPSKLQPDLIHRYLENSRVWHQFLLIGENDVVEAVGDQRISRSGRKTSSYGYLPDPPKPASRNEDHVENEWSDAELDHDQDCSPCKNRLEDQGQSRRRERPARKRAREPSGDIDFNLSPTSKRIEELREEIERLAKRRKAGKAQ